MGLYYFWNRKRVERYNLALAHIFIKPLRYTDFLQGCTPHICICHADTKHLTPQSPVMLTCWFLHGLNHVLAVSGSLRDSTEVSGVVRLRNWRSRLASFSCKIHIRFSKWKSLSYSIGTRIRKLPAMACCWRRCCCIVSLQHFLASKLLLTNKMAACHQILFLWWRQEYLRRKKLETGTQTISADQRNSFS